MPTTRRKRSRNRVISCPLGLWQVLIDDPLPESHEEYNPFNEFVRPGDWRDHKTEVLAWWVERYPATRPKNWWRFENHILPKNETQAAYLRHHDLLTAAERQYVEKHPEGLEYEEAATCNQDQ